MAKGKERNPYHVEAGSPKGGQFDFAPGAKGKGELSEQKIIESARTAAGLGPENLVAKLSEGGFSESLDGLSPTSGYMTALSKFTEVQIPKKDVTDASIMDFVVENYADLSKPNAYLGGWVEKGTVYLDVSFNYSSLEKALQVAKAGDQLGIYDVVNGETIYLKEAVK